jgi:hypothetical protein
MNSIKSAALAAGFAVAFGLPAAAFAAPATSPVNEAMRLHQPTTASVKHAVKALYETWSGTLYTSIAASTYVPVDGVTTINCTSTKGCSIHASNSVQVWASAGDGGQWCIMTEVDGNFMNHGCYYQGVINGADQFRTGNDQENLNVTFGTHSVQTFIWMDKGGTLGSYQNDYTLTVP